MGKVKALYRRAATNAILAKDCDKNAEADVSRPSRLIEVL